MNLCRLCGAHANFVKSHIIPEAFFRELRNEGQAPLLVADAKGHFPKKVPIGVYDPLILCGPCEARFLPFDTYGINVLLTRFDHFFKPLANGDNGDRPLAFESTSVDTMKLLEFLVAILWRGSVSTQPFFRSVALGPHEEDARTGLFTTTPSVSAAFDAVLSRWDSTDDASFPTTALLNPHRERWGSVNAYRIYLGKVVVHIKVDMRPFPEPFTSFSLRTGLPCRIISRKMAASKDLTAMRKTTVMSAQNRQQFLATLKAT